MTSLTFEPQKRQGSLCVPKFLAICPLDGYLSDDGTLIECGNDWDVHHWISRGKGRGRQDLRDYLDQTINLTWVCDVHNREKWADHRRAVRMILRFKVEVDGYPLEALHQFIEGIPWKVQPYELSWKGLTYETEFSIL